MCTLREEKSAKQNEKNRDKQLEIILKDENKETLYSGREGKERGKKEEPSAMNYSNATCFICDVGDWEQRVYSAFTLCQLS